MRYCCIFPETENVHLLKDIGMIPYIFNKFYKYDSYVATYKNGSYDYLDEEVKGLKLDFIRRITSNATIDSFIYVILNARKIDCLQTFHPSLRSLIQIYLYKLLNKNGKSYLKMDTNIDNIKSKEFIKNNLKGKVKKYIINKKIDLISAESKEVVDYLNKKYCLNIRYIPNGQYIENIDKEVPKENTIITVGRIGTFEKNNELLLEAFAEIREEIKNWNLKLIGPIEAEFKSYIRDYYKRNPNLKENVIFCGPIFDKNKLYKEYNKSKIFILTSRSEGFPLVCPEAMACGNYMILSNVGSANDLVVNELYGGIFKRNDKEELKRVLIDTCNRLENSYRYDLIRKRAYEEFYWPNICKNIKNYLWEEKK